MSDIRKKSIDPAVEHFLTKAFEQGIDLIWDRYEAAQPLCGFGELGLSCHDCFQGPCRIDPFGNRAQEGICGQNRDSFVANRYLKAASMGVLSRINHTLTLINSLNTLLKNLKKDKYQIDSKRLKDLAKSLGIGISGKSHERVLKDMVEAAKGDIVGLDSASDKWLSAYLPKKTLNRLKNKNMLPSLPFYRLLSSLSRFYNFNTEDCFPPLLNSFRVSLSAYSAMHIASDILDVLFGNESLASRKSNLGTISRKSINIVLHGDIPIYIAERLVSKAKRLNSKRGFEGAEEGIKFYATGENEYLRMLGIPTITNSGSQEMVILTGAIESLVMGEECVNPSLIDLCKKFHTKIFTVRDVLEKDVEKFSKDIIEVSARNYKKRDQANVDIPDIKTQVIDGFNGKILDKSVKFIADKILEGKIRGIVVFGGSNDVRQTQENKTIQLTLELLKRDVLCIAVGEAGTAFAKMGLLDPAATSRYCGNHLKRLFVDLSKKIGTQRGLPPVLNFGSSIETTKVIDFLSLIALRKRVEIRELPVIAAYLEVGQEKNITDINLMVSLGIPTFIGSIISIGGSEKVEKILTEDISHIFGASIIYNPKEENCKEIAVRLVKILNRRRKGMK
ncbi:MAG TPA: hypothetical protein VMW81_03615 [Nitrospinota bacterium]|nr:hypothetical protein [Nitrospinota bacterium]